MEMLAEELHTLMTGLSAATLIIGEHLCKKKNNALIAD